MKILFIGDIVGNPGRKTVKRLLPLYKKEHNIDFCIANGENAAGGRGLTYPVAHELYGMGIDAVTMGNHTWSKKDIVNFIDDDKRIIRPANYEPEVPGKGSSIFECQTAEGKDMSIGVVNLAGRVFMEPSENPFKAGEREIRYVKENTDIIIIDIHAEATSEKIALSWYFDGRASAVIGTHTHVQTADERILPGGTAFISDAGMTGPHDGVIGVDKKIIVEKFLTGMPVKHVLAKGDQIFNAVVINIDDNTGKAKSIKRIKEVIKL